MKNATSSLSLSISMTIFAEWNLQASDIQMLLLLCTDNET